MTKRIYVSFAKADEAFGCALQKHLKPWTRAEGVSVVSDDTLGVGEQARLERVAAAESADAIVFLVSIDFFNDEEIWEHVLKTALARQKKAGIRVVPVLVRPTDLSRTALAGRVSLPRTGKSVLMPDNDEAWVAIVKELDELLRIPPRAVPAPAALSSLRLSGKQTGQLRNLLVALFPTFKDLEMMVLIELDERLASITAEKGTAEVAFNLITWAEARGRIQDLLAGALARRPGSEELKAFVSALGAARG